MGIYLRRVSFKDKYVTESCILEGASYKIKIISSECLFLVQPWNQDYYKSELVSMYEIVFMEGLVSTYHNIAKG